MYIELMPFVCMACRHEFMAETVQRATVKVFVAALEVLYCPKCGADWHQIAMRTTEVEKPVLSNIPEQEPDEG